MRYVPKWSTPIALAGLGAAAGALTAAAFGWRWAVASPTDCPNLHTDLQFRYESACDAGLGAFKDSLLIDTSIALIAGVLLWLMLKRSWSANLDVRLQRMWKLVAAAPLVALVADGGENAALWHFVSRADATFTIDGQWAQIVFSSLVWLKWLAVTISAIAFLGKIWDKAAPRPTASDPETAEALPGPAPPPGTPPREGTLSVCLSGGGIRAAAFGLGALRAMEEAETLRHARYLSAVSGGNYSATAWTIHRLQTLRTHLNCPEPPSDSAEAVMAMLLKGQRESATDPFESDADSVPIASFDISVDNAGNGDGPVVGSSARRTRLGSHRFMINGPGGLSRAAMWALGAVLFNVAAVAAVVIVVAWPIGIITATVIHPTFRTEAGQLPGSIDIATQHWGPVAGLALAAALLLVASAGPKSERLATIGAGLLVASVVVGVFTIFVPWVLVEGFDKIGSELKATTIGGVSLATIAAVLLGLLRNPLRRNAPRLGGAALAVLLALFAGKVLRDAAAQSGALSSIWWWVGSIVVFVLLSMSFDTQIVSLRELYRARLTNSFVGGCSADRPPSFVGRVRGGTSPGVSWADIDHPNLPELLTCCAASRVGLAPNGLPAESFVISPKAVRHYRAGGVIEVPTERYTRALSTAALIPLRGPAGWMSTSGAAVASAMGSKSLGSTNALLASLNLDLGVWLPSVEKVMQGYESFPPVRLGHLGNEIFGFYADNDEYTFVSDGGHVDNLGLVELLRRNQTRIVCVDASNDEAGSYSTLRNAIRQADTELETRLQFDLSALPEQPEILDGWRAATAVYRIPFGPWTGSNVLAPNDITGVIIYAKLQPCEDQPLNLRQFANIDPKFPSYSTANQLLDDQQFLFLILAGYNAGQRAAETVAALP